MNLTNLETFTTVVKFMNFSRAADALFVSQSTVTSRIKSLEDELKAELFFREGKAVRLTAIGERFFEHSLKIQEMLRACEQDISIYNKFKNYLSVCAPDSVWEYTLSDSISKFMSDHPDTAMKLKCGYSEFVVQDLLLGLADVGVIFQKIYGENVEIHDFFQSKFHLVAQKNLVPKNITITPENIQSYNPILIEWGPEFNSWYNKYYKTQIHFYEIDGTSLFVNMLLNGRGIGFLPDRIAKNYISSGQLECLDFQYSDTIPVDHAYIVFIKKNKEKVKEFLEAIKINL